MVPIIPAAVAGALIASYVDAKYYIGSDLAKIKRGWQQGKGLAGLIASYEDKCSVYEALHRTKGVHDDKLALIFEDRQWRFKEIRIEVERLEQEFIRLGIKNRDYIGIFMDNSPEFFFTFWALVKIGAIPATINTSLKKDRLLYCVDLPKPKLLLTTYALHSVLEEATRNSPYKKKLICYDHDTYVYQANMSPLILHWNLKPAKSDGNDWIPPRINRKDPGMLLYTSGTTGMPKASIIPAFFMLACTYASPLLTPEDRVYCPLPLFHGTAILIGVLCVYGHPSTVVLSRKFSNSKFWPEVRQSKTTVVIFIGEMIRYLCQAPPSPLDNQNHLRAFWGLGLQDHSNWLALRHRFGVGTIIEYYGSTEGTSTQYNINYNDAYGVGKCGHRGPLLRYIDKRFVLVKHNLATGTLYRNKNGFCEKTAPDELGEALTLTDEYITPHDYLNNAKASTEKIVRNVLKKGDAYVRMGDLLSYDRDGFLQFKDRLGDTYRVKGHNISTTEIEECLNRHPDIAGSTCYSTNGLGMASIIVVEGRSREKVVRGLEAALIGMGLPKYAVPTYLRLVSSFQTTATHKIAKAELKKEGLKGEVYTIQREGEGYIPLLIPDAKL